MTLTPTPIPPQYKWDTIPEILYEEPSVGGKGNPIPYIDVPKTKEMPPVLFVFEYKRTGEYEPDSKGKPAEIVDQIPHRYADLEYLFLRLDPSLHDIVRCSLGMKPKNQAEQDGAAVMERVLGKEQELRTAAEVSQQERIGKMQEAYEAVKSASEKRKTKKDKRKARK